MEYKNKKASWILPLEAEPSSRLALIRRFCMSPLFMWLTFACGAAFMIFGQPIAATLLPEQNVTVLTAAVGITCGVFFLILISVLLIICDDILATTLPFLILCMSVLRCYDLLNTIKPFMSVIIPFAAIIVPLPIAALLFHFIRYRRPIQIGDSLWGHIGVSVAVICGGIGAISAAEYFSGGALYYVLMLGVGLLVAYLLMKSQIHERADYDIREKLLSIMLIAGLFACLEVGYLVARSTITAGLTSEQFVDIFVKVSCRAEGLTAEANEMVDRTMQPSNNLSTFLMILLPVTFYRAVKKHPAYILLSFLFMAGLYFTKSRSGLILGSIEFVLCFIVFSLLIERRSLKLTFFGLGVLILIVGGITGYIFLRNSSMINDNEVRYDLLLRSFEDFKSNPLFGQGIGSRKNADLYPGKEGTLIWYHMMIPQIYGSLGIVGILGYGLQLFTRVRLFFKKFNGYTLVFFMSYIGLLMMSQINPGEFCPLPYGLIAVLLFIMIENEPDRIKPIKN